MRRPQRLRELRKNAGWSIQEAATHIGISTHIIRQLENVHGDHRISTFEKVAKVYGVSLMYILYGE